MKYFVRAVKYFFCFVIILALIILALVLLGMATLDPADLFREGWKSLGQIALLFAFISAFYPKFGFNKTNIRIGGEYSEVRQGVIDAMQGRGYVLETEEGENMTFRLRSKFRAVIKMLEDRITLTRTMEGFEMEGLTKDIVKLRGAIEYKFRSSEDEQ